MRSRVPKEQLEEIIVDAAKRIVEEEGLPGLTARNVAKEAGYAVGTIYNAFRNMDDLILRINADTLRLMRDEFAVALAKPRKGQSLGRIFAKFYIGFADRYTSYWSLLFEFKYQQGQPLPHWYEALVDQNFGLIETAIAPLIPDDPKLVKQASRVIWASFHGIVTLSMTGKLRLGSREAPERLSESLFENYIKGLTS